MIRVLTVLFGAMLKRAVKVALLTCHAQSMYDVT